MSSVVTLAAAGLAHGQITVDGIDSWSLEGSPILGNFDASASDKLVVIVTGEHGFNQTGNGDGGIVTYDGVPMTQLVNRDTIQPSPGPVDDTWNDIWYLDDPSTSTGLISATASTRGSVTVIGLSGTADGAGNTVIGPRDSNSADLVTSADSIVIASYGMGGSGNSADYGNVDANLPLIESSAQGNRNWDGHVTGYALGVAAGNATYSFNDGSTAGAHVIAVEFLLGPPPPLLTLQVNTGSGSTLLLGNEDEAVSISYYELTSAGDSLTSSGWSSLADQDLEGNGPPNGSGNGWEEAGGSNDGILAEAYLLDNSTIPSGGQVNLGLAYRPAVDARDLAFRYLTSNGKIYDANIVYTTPAESFAEAATLAGLSGADAEPDAIPFSDGLANLLKYAFNMDLSGPDSSDLTPGTGTSGLPIYTLVEGVPQDEFRVEYLRRRNSGLIYTPKYSVDMITFQPMTGTETVVAIDEDWERVSVGQLLDEATTPHCFGLIEVVLP